MFCTIQASMFYTVLYPRNGTCSIPKTKANSLGRVIMPFSVMTISNCIRHAQARPLHATMLFPAHSRQWKIWPADSARVIPSQHSTDRSHIPFMSPHSTSGPMIENTDLQLVVMCHARPKYCLMSPEDKKIEWVIDIRCP